MENRRILEDNRRAIRLLGAPAILLLCLLLWGCNGTADGGGTDRAQRRPVKVLVVKTTASEDTRSAPGIVKAVKEIGLAFRVGGPLVEYDLKIGQSVKKGRIIARIDPRDFEIRIRKLSADVKAARVKLSDAEIDFNRQKNLLSENAASQAQYDKAKLALETSAAVLEGLQADLTEAGNALADTVLRAPFDGVVHRKLTENHETVKPGIPVVSLLDISAVEVRTVVPEDIVIRVSDIVDMFCTLDAYPEQSFPALLKELGRQTDSTNQSYPMTVVLDTPPGLSVEPGMAATVHLVLNNATQPAGGIYLPTAAVFADTNKDACVWRIRPDSLETEKVRVKTGALKGDSILITSGLMPQDRVVSAGARFLLEGQPIRILDNDRETPL